MLKALEWTFVIPVVAFFLCLGSPELPLLAFLIFGVLRHCEVEGFETPNQQSWRFVGLLALLVCLFFVVVTISLPHFLTLVFGWLSLLARTIPRMKYDWVAIAVTAGSLIAFLVGSHWFARTIYDRPADDLRPARVWQPRWTGAIALAFFLTFASGLMAYGLVQSSIEVWKLRESR